MNPEDELEGEFGSTGERGKREVEVHVTLGSIQVEVWTEASQVAATPQGFHPWRRFHLL